MPEIKELLGRESLLAIKDYIDNNKSEIEQDLSTKEDKSNKVTSLSDASTDIQYPSAKAVYDELQLKADKVGPLPEINGNSGTSISSILDKTSGKEFILKYQTGINIYDYYLSTMYPFLFGTSFSFIKIGGDNFQNKIIYYSGLDFEATTLGNLIKDSYKKEVEITNNKVTSISASSTDTQYPSAKAVYDFVKDEPNLIETTWSALKTLRDNSQLIPGKFYRITDYTCTTTTTNTSSAGHVFDIIVRADSVNKLNEEASAILHSGDTYFANNKLEAWKLWYCLDNDTNRFSWADTANGKGVIYRMIDEFNNDCPYDFKNILFTSSGKYTNAYTFSYTEDSTIKDASILGISKSCYSNIMKEYINSNKQQLNFNVFYSIISYFNCYSNIFGNGCYLNTFSYGCYSNTFSYGCYSNVFGNNCESNIFGNNYYSNTFGSYCVCNIFGNNCHNNRFGDGCNSNIFGNYCFYHAFGNECTSNIFENSCISNTFGNYCYYNTLGSFCTSNTFGNNCSYNILGKKCQSNIFGDSSSAIDYCGYNIIDNGCSYLYINGNGTASSSDYLQNIHIHSGVAGTSSTYKTITVDRGLTYETNIVPAGTTTIEV